MERESFKGVSDPSSSATLVVVSLPLILLLDKLAVLLGVNSQWCACCSIFSVTNDENTAYVGP
jgi:hypothetical protein